MELMYKVVGMVTVSLLFSAVIKKDAPEQALMIGLCVCVGIIFLLGSSIAEILESMKNLAEIAKMDQSLLLPVAKTVAISILTKISGEMCRSAGEGGMASFVEFAGAILSLVVALPMIEGVMTMMTTMLS